MLYSRRYIVSQSTIWIRQHKKVHDPTPHAAAAAAAAACHPTGTPPPQQQHWQLPQLSPLLLLPCASCHVPRHASCFQLCCMLQSSTRGASTSIPTAPSPSVPHGAILLQVQAVVQALAHRCGTPSSDCNAPPAVLNQVQCSPKPNHRCYSASSHSGSQGPAFPGIKPWSWINPA
jgi:hypothetical protein